MIYQVLIEGREFEIELDSEKTLLDGMPVSADIRASDGTSTHSIILDGSSHSASVSRTGGGAWEMTIRGRTVSVRVQDAARAMDLDRTAPATVSPEIEKTLRVVKLRAPMPGLVVRVEVQVGSQTEVGDGLVIVEAMKMENELGAEVSGQIRAVHISPGDIVEQDQVLVEIDRGTTRRDEA